MKQFRDALYIDWTSDPRYGDLGARDMPTKSLAENLYKTVS